MVLVVDIGTTSLSAALVGIGEGVIEVMTNQSDPGVGGLAWRAAVAAQLRRQAYAARHVDLYHDEPAERRLQLPAEDVLLALHDGDRYHADVSGVDPRCDQLRIPVTQADLEDVTAALTTKVQASLEPLLANEPPDVVLLTGGVTRLRHLGRAIQRLTPGVRTRYLPPEAAALGAAVNAGVLRGHVKDSLLLASITRSIGIVTHDGRVLPVLPKDTCVPSRVCVEGMGPATDALLIHVVEGDAEWLHDCSTIGYAELPPTSSSGTGPRRAVVDIDVDANHLLWIKVTDLNEGTRTVVPVQPDAFPPQNPLHRYPYAHLLQD